MRTPLGGMRGQVLVLGGHLLVGMGLISQVRSALGVEIPIRTVFDSPSPAGLAERLAEANEARMGLQQRQRPLEIPLSFAQRRLWFLNRLEGPSPTYTIPVALRLRGRLEATAMEAAFGDLI